MEEKGKKEKKKKQISIDVQNPKLFENIDNIIDENKKIDDNKKIDENTQPQNFVIGVKSEIRKSFLQNDDFAKVFGELKRKDSIITELYRQITTLKESNRKLEDDNKKLLKYTPHRQNEKLLKYRNDKFEIKELTDDTNKFIEKAHNFYFPCNILVLGNINVTPSRFMIAKKIMVKKTLPKFLKLSNFNPLNKLIIFDEESFIENFSKFFDKTVEYMVFVKISKEESIKKIEELLKKEKILHYPKLLVFAMFNNLTTICGLELHNGFVCIRTENIMMKKT